MKKVDITGISLMSVAEYMTYNAQIPHIEDAFWLKSRGYDIGKIMFVLAGTIIREGKDCTSYCGLRPIITGDFAGLEGKIGKFEGNDTTTVTVVSDTKAIFNTVIAKDIMFNAHNHSIKADDSNYDISDIKYYIETELPIVGNEIHFEEK